MAGRRRFITSIATAVLAALGATPAIAAAPPGAADGGLPNVDRRDADPAAVPARTRAARGALERSLGPLADVRTAASGAVAYVGRATGLLTGPSSDDPRTIALDYVRDHGEVFGLAKADVANLVLVARDVSPDGITHLRFNQVLDGVQSFDGGLEAHVTRDGRLINVSGAPLPGAALSTTTPALSALAGLGAARQATRGAGLPPRQTAVGGGPRRITTFATGEQVQLRWSAGPQGPVLAWQAIADGGDGHLYDVLVDADGGALLRRQDLTNHLGQARYLPRDPDANAVPTQLTMPPAWYDDSAGGTRLWGQFARTYVDPTDFDPAGGNESNAALTQIPASAGAPAAPDWLYTQGHGFPAATPCPASGCTWDSAAPATYTANQFQAATNVHVLNSRFHDYLALAPIGFDEASGNFQRTNTSGQGFGNDYVKTEVDDGVTKLPAPTFNNANMSTPPDGQTPRMQMFLFTTFDVNGSDVADIVYHEYGHGLSNRLVVNAAGSSTLNSAQATMMGEAWSDFYAIDLLVAEGSMTDTVGVANLTTGDYAVGPGGVRAKAIDCPVNAAGQAGCNANGTVTTVLGGYTYGDIAATNNASPHNGGEIWGETLWDLRTAVGRLPALALITGGMRLSVGDPSMLDMRDAILQQAVAMRSAPGASDDYYDEVWSVFRARGMGASATTPGASATTATEAFNAPSGLRARTTTLRDPYPGGDNDGLIEPGERFFVEQAIEGIGLADLQGVTGTMTSTGAPLTIEDGTAAWPLLGRGRRAINGDALVGRLPAAACTATSMLAINVTSAEGSVTANALVDPRPATTTVVPLADGAGTPAAPIPQSTDATFTVPSGGAITDVNLRIDELRHTWLGDLEIRLVHDGVTVLITDNFGDANFSGDDIIGAIFDDAAAALPPNTGAGPVTGVVKPAGLLSAFNAHPAAGVWTLRITDTFPFDSGVLRRWGLSSPEAGCTRVEIPAAATGSATGVGADAATLGGGVTPNGRATGLRFSYGTTTAYGTSTAVQDVGAGDAGVAGTAALTGLAPSTTYHFRAEAIRESGAVAVAGGDATFTTTAAGGGGGGGGGGGAGGGGAAAGGTGGSGTAGGGTAEGGTAGSGVGGAGLLDSIKPVFTGRPTVTLTKATTRGRKRATFSFTLSEAASVTVVVTRSAKGVKQGRTCVAPARKGTRCTRQVAAGTATASITKPGPGTLRMSAAGLRKGGYAATLVATDAARNRSDPKQVKFTVR